MPCISVSIIKKPRKSRICPMCYKKIDGETARLFGNGHSGDPTYALYLHPSCVSGKESLRKLRAVRQ